MTCIDQDIGEGLKRRVTILNKQIARIQIAPQGDLADSGLNRYGFIVEPDGTDVQVTTASDDKWLTYQTSGFTIRCAKEGAALSVSDSQGRVLLEPVAATVQKQGAAARFRASPDEDWIGFGDQTRERLFHRGHFADCQMLNVKSYIPVPFFMSTRGVGVLVNTTHRVLFDMCKSDPEHFEWRDGRGVIDYYVMIGDSFRELIDVYTSLTGRPKLPPEWAFGLWYICRTQANDYEAVNDALNFRREGIPCDVIGLEPGWMEKHYDESLEKKWSKERFPIPSYAQKGPHNFFSAIQRMNFRMELWLCCDYDLSYEAERRIGTTASEAEQKAESAFFQHDAEHDAHFQYPRSMDTVTKREEPWFQHLQKFVDQGIDFFKQDGAFQVLEHPDRLWGNGMRDSEMHNLNPLLYVRQMQEGFENYTGRRAVTFTPSGWTGFQAWSGTWTGDTGGRLPTLGALLNTAIVGHSWMTNDMEVAEREGIHFGYLLPWSQINSWTYFRMPWVQGAALLAMHQTYSRLRAQLIPYLYAWAWHATQTGFPLLAPLTLEFQDDLQCRDVMHQYLLGRDFMVTIYKPEVYFPAGRWKDYWSGAIIEGEQRVTITWPADRGGGLFVREGAIIPFGPVMQYRGEMPLTEIELYVFPGIKESTFELYEDDGVSLENRNDAFSCTPIRAHREGTRAIIRVGASHGTFKGQLMSRKWSFRVAIDFTPAQVTLNGQTLDIDDWSFDADRRELFVQASSGPVELLITA